ncbi:MAG TPA: Rrf2 family transcriptional regulator [Syntrophomonadaceae bacterium]|nr:Rrf2 family transcriptional regulator [Syntrophomonadaceae bacterium]
MLSSRFPVAVQILIILQWCSDDVKITSEVIASSVNTNPVIIRRIMGYLKKHDLITTASSADGAKLLKKADQITLLDVYKAVELTEANKLFALHENTNPYCPIGSRINDVLELHLGEARNALEVKLDSITIQDLVSEFIPFDDFTSSPEYKSIERFFPNSNNINNK